MVHTAPPPGIRRKPRRRAAMPDAEDRAPRFDLPLEAATVDVEEVLAFRRPGVRDQVLRRLKRGQYRIEDEVDLHGLNQAAARDLLADFIEASRAHGLRCVRIIHGKGYRSGARGPVLKSAVNEWLRRHPDVVAFASARPLDGGTGAVYALLHA
jgi:DNA-nicking Smr family endonuclease